MTTSNFTIKGLHCESCLKLVPMLLKDIEGVQDVRISGFDGQTEIDADRAITKEEVSKVLEGTDYQVA